MKNKLDILLHNNLNDVSRETEKKINQYYDLVIKWNRQINLVSNNDINYLWERHFLDCIELAKILQQNNDNKVLVDFGSGAGFPSIIIAIFNKNLKIKLIESISKKANFLEEVNRILDLNLEIYNKRIEQISNLEADIITSRAFADIDNTLEYAQYHSTQSTEIYTFKGKKLSIELDKAFNRWDFRYDVHESKILNQANIVNIRNIKRKK